MHLGRGKSLDGREDGGVEGEIGDGGAAAAEPGAGQKDVVHRQQGVVQQGVQDRVPAIDGTSMSMDG